MPGVYIGTSELKSAYVGTTPVKEIYVGTTKVRPMGWTPGANTLAYYALNGNLTDGSGNGYNGTWTGTSAYATGIGGEQCANFSRNYNNMFSSSLQTAPKTVSFFMKWADLNSTRQDRRQIIGMTSSLGGNGWCFRAKPTKYNSSSIDGTWAINNPSYYTLVDTSMVNLNRHHFCLTTNNSNVYFYCDGVLKATWGGSLPAGGNFKAGKGSSSSDNPLNAYMQHIIIESVQWSQADIQTYLSYINY